MAKRLRRSEAAYLRKMLLMWVVSLFFLVLLVLLDIVIVYNQTNSTIPALSEEIDYSKINFEGLAVNENVPDEVLKHPIVDSNYNYAWNNVSVYADENNMIKRLGFYTTEPSAGNKAIEDVNIHNTVIDYRGYPILTVADFVTFFGYTKVTNFGHYKYLTYQDERCSVDITLYNGEIYNIELTAK